MPTYEYACLKCGHEFEVFQSMKDDRLKTCTCGKKGKVRRKIGGGAGLIFKGSGFYETDYRRKPTGGDKSSAETASPAPTPPKTETNAPTSAPPSTKT